MKESVAVVYVHGWLGLGGSSHQARKIKADKIERWSNADIHPYSWEAGSGKDKVSQVSRKVLKKFDEYLKASALVLRHQDPRLKTLIAGLAGLRVSAQLALLGRDFQKAVDNSHAAAIGLQSHLHSLSQQYDRIDLLAHSAGCRVVHTAMRDAAAKGTNVRDIILMGGAIPAYHSWWGVSQNIDGRISNFGTRWDPAQIIYHRWLNALGRSRHGRSIGSPRPSGIGTGINTRLAAVTNYDVTDIIKGVNAHSAFFPKLDTLIEKLGPPQSRKRTRKWQNEFTWTPTPSFGRRRRGIQAEIVQRALTQVLEDKTTLLKPEDVTGVYGKKTRKAVKDFQKLNNLHVDGLVGKKTWEYLVGKAAFFK